MQKLLQYIGSYLAMGLLMIVLAVAIGFATFFEKYYGLEASWGLVYATWWFNLLWFLLAINLLAALMTRAKFSRNRLGIFLFHLAFLVIIVGAGFTRFVGTSGMLHLREGAVATSYMSDESYLQVADNSGNVLFRQQVNVSPYADNSFSASVATLAGNFDLELVRYIPNSSPVLVPDPMGVPVIKLVVATVNGRYSQLLAQGEVIKVDGIAIGYDTEQKCDLLFKGKDSTLSFTAKEVMMEGAMANTDGAKIEANTSKVVKTSALYAASNYQFVVAGLAHNSRVEYMPQHNSNAQTLEFKATLKGITRTLFLTKSAEASDWSPFLLDGTTFLMRYGPKEVKLPFSVKLNRFSLERYSGSESPSAFSSNVTVTDEETGSSFERSVSMNRVLDYQGYRFYQASYDTDEKGTILRITQDLWGMSLTYLGYGLFMVGVLFMALSRRTKLYGLLSSTRSKAGVVVALLLLPLFSNGQELPTPDRDHAAKFGQLLVLSRDGRIHPLNTISGEITRKLTGSGSFGNLTADQLVLGMTAFPDFYQSAPIIKLGNQELQRMLGVTKPIASFVDLFDTTNGGYKLQKYVAEINQKTPVSRTKLDKEILKVDERVNICYSIFTGSMLKLFPGEKGEPWLSVEEALANGGDTSVRGRLLLEYFTAIRFTTSVNSYQKADSTLSNFASYQKNAAGISFDGYPGLELVYNKIKPFERIIPIYGLAGLGLLVLLFFRRWRHSLRTTKVLIWTIVAGLAVHTVGLAMRWIIAGHSPMSNGYESMLMVSWVAVVGGLLLAKKMPTMLGIAAILATATLFVAHLSWMDPEITNLVPVLKSKWLTMHVSFVMAGYAFFGLAALLGFLSLVVIAVPKLYSRVEGEEFTQIQQLMSAGMVIGLYLFTIGTFLGAIWANESWGRYWGWDPKESWALITIFVYVIITHLDNIPGFKNPIALSFSSLIGFITVLMTYFGVNYLLSGLHSYASGDATRIPWGVYVGLGIIVLVWIAAMAVSSRTIFRKKIEPITEK